MKKITICTSNNKVEITNSSQEAFEELTEKIKDKESRFIRLESCLININQIEIITLENDNEEEGNN